jgi:hypothetical protein
LTSAVVVNLELISTPGPMITAAIATIVYFEVLQETILKA